MAEFPAPDLSPAAAGLSRPGSPLNPQDSTSLGSSFVPVDVVQDAIQLIDENKQFNNSVLEYITTTANAAHDHRIISVFGSQSTGKSTLLNALFHTNFGVMDEGNRQQTTKGIWLAHSPSVSNSVSDRLTVLQSNILVMDVEGTDGRERGEDQDFERKAALFALATSEVLIVNLWETQVGLYQGANMGLLKTVFEVNLSLFGKAKLESHSDHKVLLLFVIRDHLGVTPKDSLAATITQDLLKIWDNLNKPADVAHLAFHDFFDLAFHTLSHKVLQNDKFLKDIELLGNRFIDASDEDFLFKPFYHHDIPIEGWTMYAESCWDQIDNNKDLDLPTQQILVAKFKCDEIVSSCYEDFLLEFDDLKAHALAESSNDFKIAGQALVDCKNRHLTTYDSLASKYNSSIYEQRRQVLTEKLNGKLGELVTVYSKRLLADSIKTFTAGLGKKTRGVSFTETVSNLTDSLTSAFAESLAFLSLNGELNTNEFAETLEDEVSKLVAKQQIIELNAIISKFLRKLNNALSSTILDEVSKPSEATWDHIMQHFNNFHSEFLTKHTTDEGTVDFGVGAPATVNEITLKTVEYRAWTTLDDLIHKYFSKQNVFNVLKDRFDDKFRYDQNGVPRLYQNAKELEAAFGESKAFALKAFSTLTAAKYSDGSEVKPKVNLTDKNLKRKYETVTLENQNEEVDSESDDDQDLERIKAFSEVLSEKDKEEVMAKFKKETDAMFVETKRSIMQHVTQIPYYIYLVILVLGWNEFMAVLRNPFFFTLLVILAGAGYVMYQTNLLGPAMVVTQRMVDEAVAIGKQKLREFIIDEHEQHGRNLSKLAEEIELDDLEPESD